MAKDRPTNQMSKAEQDKLRTDSQEMGKQATLPDDVSPGRIAQIEKNRSKSEADKASKSALRAKEIRQLPVGRPKEPRPGEKCINMGSANQPAFIEAYLMDAWVKVEDIPDGLTLEQAIPTETGEPVDMESVPMYPGMLWGLPGESELTRPMPNQLGLLIDKAWMHNGRIGKNEMTLRLWAVERISAWAEAEVQFAGELLRIIIAKGGVQIIIGGGDPVRE